MTTPALWLRADASFPAQLTEIPSAPKELHTLGNRSILNAPCIAIVGTRRPTAYGERVTRDLAQALSRAGACVVSGMAAGVDGIAHRTVLETGGSTVAVLGSGVDYAYPRSHSSLHQSIANNGLVISEFGDARVPFPGCFPRRNRIIAGLSSLTIVVEASLKSGALITANYAAEYGRTVAAVPGPITSEQSQGANQLIRDGANVIAHVDDALMLAGLSSASNAGNVANEPKLEGDQALVWSAIASGRDVDAIGIATGLSASRCAVAITMLEMQGLVTCLLNGELQKRR